MIGAAAPSPFPANKRHLSGAFCLLALGAIVVLVTLARPGLAQATLSARDQAIIRLNIVDLLANEPRLPLPIKQRREVLSGYYDTAQGNVLFVGTGRAEQMVARLDNALDDGLRPKDYPVAQLGKLAGAIPISDNRGLAVIELYFAAAFLEYASDLQVGRFLPAKIDPNFFLASRQIDGLEAINALAAKGDLDGFFAGWEPQNPAYGALKAQLADYRALAAAGGWPGVPLGETLKPGMSDVRVAQLRARLQVTDGAAPAGPDADATFYDPALEGAVRQFQARHGLEVDGAVGPATIVALNTPVEERIKSLILAMERWRWMPENLGDQHIMVNIAGFELRRVNAGRIEEKMAVVVGKP